MTKKAFLVGELERVGANYSPKEAKEKNELETKVAITVRKRLPELYGIT